MAKKESTFFNMVLMLVLITAISALSVTIVNQMTKEPIAAAQKAKKEAAIQKVIPNFDSFKEAQVTTDKGESLSYIEGFNKDGNLIGIAVEAFSKKGYDPTPIKVMVGFKPDGTVVNTVVLSHKETPGLGTKMADESFKGQFNNKNPQSFNITVKKDGGDVDAITAATISSRAFCDAIDQAYKVFINQQKEK